MGKKIAMGIGAGVVALVVAVLVFAALRPATIRVERSIDIQAPPDKVFGLVNALYNWRLWSPWEKIDPDMQRTYSGEFEGKGEIYEWRGNDKVGQGRMEIVNSASPQQVVLMLDFSQPYDAHSKAQFDLVPAVNGTRVTWTMIVPNPYMARLTSLFVNPGAQVSKDFEVGLANLKVAAEQPAPNPQMLSNNE